MSQENLKDPVFIEEQTHLSETFDKLKNLGKKLASDIQKTQAEAAETKQAMSEELAVNFASYADAMETYADFSAMNRIIDSYNIAQDANTENLKKVNILLKQPYFAKISLQFKPDEAPKDLYIGNVGISDENYRRL